MKPIFICLAAVVVSALVLVASGCGKADSVVGVADEIRHSQESAARFEYRAVTEWQGPFQWYGPLIRFYGGDSLRDSINDNLPPKDWFNVSGSEVCYKFTPASTFQLRRIEYYSTAPGLVYVVLRELDNGKPGAILRQITFQSEVEGWQGEDFESSYALESGNEYFTCYGHERGIMRFTAGETGVHPFYYWRFIEFEPFS